MSGVLLAKTMGQGGELTDRFRNESRLLADLEIRQRMTGRWVMASLQTAFAVMPALVYLFAGHAMASGFTTVSIGTLVAFTTLQTRLFFPVGSLLGVQADVQTSLALFERIFEYLDQPVDIAEPEDPVPLPPPRGEVTFDHVSFSYAEGQPTLSDVSFSAEPGTKVAVVGETGSGKTTLGYLVARLYDPQSGSVRIDGVDVRDLLLADLASVVGVVSQETYLFHGSVRDNLRFAMPRRDRRGAGGCRPRGRIYDMLAGLPEGLDTVVGERGYRFSGGERQRLAIARTILRNPPVLVLDEATSSLDVETERQVQEALDTLAAGPDDGRDRAPAVDRPRRRPDHRARPRTHRRARHPRRAAGDGWTLRGAGGARLGRPGRLTAPHRAHGERDAGGEDDRCEREQERGAPQTGLPQTPGSRRCRVYCSRRHHSRSPTGARARGSRSPSSRSLPA